MQIIVGIALCIVIVTIIIYKLNDKFEKKEFFILILLIVALSSAFMIYEKYSSNLLPNMFKERYEKESNQKIKSLDYELLNNKVVSSKDKFVYKFIFTLEKDDGEYLCIMNNIEINRVKNEYVFINFDKQKQECFKK